MQSYLCHKPLGIQPVTADVEKACEAAKSHDLLTARILRFIQAAQTSGMVTKDVTFDGCEAIVFEIDQLANASRGIYSFSVSIIPGAFCCPAIQLGKLRTLHGSTYSPEKAWPHPTDDAFRELLEIIKQEDQRNECAYECESISQRRFVKELMIKFGLADPIEGWF